MKQKILDYWARNKRVLLIVVAACLIFVLPTIFFLAQKQTSKEAKPTPPTQETTQQTKTYDAPTVYFQKYQNAAAVPTVPQAINVYTLKNSFSISDITQFANKFGIATMDETQAVQSVGSNLTDIEKKGVLSFDKKTGAFNYQSFGAIKAASYQPGQDPKVTAANYLNEIGFSPQTLSCPITYQREHIPGVVFVECHYDWAKLGLPYYSFAGLLNVPATTPLSSLQIGILPENAPADESVFDVSTGDHGKMRPNDFNTATIGFRQDGSIHSIDSNLRWIQSKQPFASAQYLKTPEEALSQFLKHNAQLSFTIPAGAGPFDYVNVYKDNKANADEAVITDYTLSYLERPAGTAQKYFVPMYTIKGVAVLDTGYRVRFVETVPALKSEQSFLSFIQTTSEKKTSKRSFFSIPKAYAQEEAPESLQLKTFYPSTPTSKPFQPKQQVPQQTGNGSIPGNGATPDLGEYKLKDFDTPSGSEQVTCEANSGNLLDMTKGSIYKVNVPGYGVVDLKLHEHTFFYKSGPVPLAAKSEIKTALHKDFEEQYVISMAKRLTSDKSSMVSSLKTVDDMKILFSTINGGSCPLLSLDSRPAPVYNCPGGGVAGAEGFDTAATNATTTNVATRLLALIQQNQLSTEAAKPDLFAPSTLISFHAVYVQVNSSMVYGGDSHCYITGNSPALFLYTPSKQSVTITLPSTQTYTDPAVDSNRMWNVMVNPNGVIETDDKTIQKYLYYEFDKRVSFETTEEGFTVAYDLWESAIHSTLAKQLGLTSEETDRLVLDVKQVLSQQNYSPYLTLSLADQQEVNEKLPLTINPQPDKLHRIMVLVSPVMHNKFTTEPRLSLVERSGFTVVEVGAKAANKKN